MNTTFKVPDLIEKSSRSCRGPAAVRGSTIKIPLEVSGKVIVALNLSQKTCLDGLPITHEGWRG